jgi:NADPH:quinone reductase-like Zn-dependent oxidoreductase
MERAAAQASPELRTPPTRSGTTHVEVGTGHRARTWNYQLNSTLSRKPERLTAEAAAVGRSLINMMEIMPGETILITGGAGMVGQAAAAIARWRGAEAIIAGRRRPDGVERFIDTSSSDIREAVLELTDGRGADLVLDTVGGALFERALRSLRYDGRMVGLHGGAEPITFDLNETAARHGTRHRVL